MKMATTHKNRSSTSPKESMEHQYNTRLRKSRDEHSNEDKRTEAGKITEFLRSLEVEFNKEFGDKKVKEEAGSNKPPVEEDIAVSEAN